MQIALQSVYQKIIFVFTNTTEQAVIYMGATMEQIIFENECITYYIGKTLNQNEIYKLFSSVDWLSANYANRLETAFQKVGLFVSAWMDNQLIGLIEVLDDGELNAYIHYLLVRPEYQLKGVGAQLINIAKEHYKNYLYLIVICEKEENVSFYKKMNFQRQGSAVPLIIMNK